MSENTNHPLPDILGDVWVPVQVLVGQIEMQVNDILEIKEGDLIRFDKVVGESLDVLVAEKLMARGEIVVVNESYGCRLSEVLRAEDSFKEGIDRL